MWWLYGGGGKARFWLSHDLQHSAFGGRRGAAWRVAKRVLVVKWRRFQRCYRPESQSLTRTMPGGPGLALRYILTITLTLNTDPVTRMAACITLVQSLCMCLMQA